MTLLDLIDLLSPPGDGSRELNLDVLLRRVDEGARVVRAHVVMDGFGEWEGPFLVVVVASSPANDDGEPLPVQFGLRARRLLSARLPDLIVEGTQL